MPTSIVFGGKTITKPGAYSRIKSGVTNPPIGVSYGKVLMIDLGTSTDNFVGGSGVTGTHFQGKNSIKSYKSIQDFQQKGTRGGIFWQMVKEMFNPDKSNFRGTDEVFVIKAATTTPGSLAWTLTNGSFTLQTWDEGVCANGLALNKAATTKITITNAGGVGATITFNANGGLIATYTSTGGTIKDAVAALATAIQTNTVDGYKVIEKGADYLIVEAPTALGATANSYASAVPVTGTAAATATTPFSGGANNYYLYKGYGVKMVAGVNNGAATYRWEFYLGNWTGLDSYSKNFDGISQADAGKSPTLLFKSPDVENLQALYDWMATDYNFNQWFKLSASAATGVGVLTAGDLSGNINIKLATGGTATYSTQALLDALTAVSDLDYNFIITDNWGANAKSAFNTAILDHLVNTAKYQKYLVVAGGNTQNDFATSIDIATYYNSNRVIVVHGGLERNTALGYRKYESIVKAAAVLGRICGLPPQVPVTFKSVNIDRDLHNLTELEINTGLQRGLTMTQFDTELNDYIVVQGITSIQPVKNDNLIEDVGGDAVSFDIAVERVIAQVMKLFSINVKRSLLNQSFGVNKSTLNQTVVSNWTKDFLSGLLATPTADNLLISFKNILVTTISDTIYVEFEIEPNTPINKICIIGTLIDPTLQNLVPS